MKEIKHTISYCTVSVRTFVISLPAPHGLGEVRLLKLEPVVKLRFCIWVDLLNLLWLRVKRQVYSYKVASRC